MQLHTQACSTCSTIRLRLSPRDSRSTGTWTSSIPRRSPCQPPARLLATNVGPATLSFSSPFHIPPFRTVLKVRLTRVCNRRCRIAARASHQPAACRPAPARGEGPSHDQDGGRPPSRLSHAGRSLCSRAIPTTISVGKPDVEALGAPCSGAQRRPSGQKAKKYACNTYRRPPAGH
jgi:hypothetical protein